MPKKQSFFERLTGSAHSAYDDELEPEDEAPKGKLVNGKGEKTGNWIPDEPEEGQLSVDVYQTPNEIIIQTMVAGVRPEDLSINITRDMVTIKGKREEARTISDENYFSRELYWGAFSRTISLPQEVEPEEAEAIERHGLLIIKLPKIDKGRQTTLKVKSM